MVDKTQMSKPPEATRRHNSNLRHFKHATFTKRLEEDNRLKTVQDRTEREADIEGVATI